MSLRPPVTPTFQQLLLLLLLLIISSRGYSLLKSHLLCSWWGVPMPQVSMRCSTSCGMIGSWLKRPLESFVFNKYRFMDDERVGNVCRGLGKSLHRCCKETYEDTITFDDFNSITYFMARVHLWRTHRSLLWENCKYSALSFWNGWRGRTW